VFGRTKDKVQLANDVRVAVDELNRSIRAAVDAGLNVDIERVDDIYMPRRSDRTYPSGRLYKVRGIREHKTESY
jgi:hypothetical protein